MNEEINFHIFIICDIPKQWKKTNNGYIQQHGWILVALKWVKESIYKAVHSASFLFCDILE